MVLRRQYPLRGWIVALWLGASFQSLAAPTQTLTNSGSNEPSAESAPETGDPADSTIVVRGNRISPLELQSAFGQSIDVLDEVKGLRTTAEVLSEQVGVQVRKTGGIGSHGAASIRGSTAGQVAIYLDDVLLNAGGFPSVNLGDLTLDELESIEVYRGSAPARFGIAGIGGVISLTTRQFHSSVLEAALSVGSWNTWRAFGFLATPVRSWKLLGAVSLTFTDGDYPYLNRNGTLLLNEEDDRVLPRQNNQSTSIQGLLKASTAFGHWQIALSEDAAGKHQGIPATDNVRAENAATLDTFRNAASMVLERRLEAHQLGLRLSHLFLREVLDDTHTPQGETGLGQQKTVALTQALGAAGLWEWSPHPQHRITTNLEVLWERFAYHDLIRHEEPGPEIRFREGLAIDDAWQIIEGLFVLPVLRGGLQQVAFAGGPRPDGLGVSASQRLVRADWSAALGMRKDFRVIPGLSVKLNAGRYVRSPDLSEWFGDRGNVIGNPDLMPEEGLNLDAGWVYARASSGALTLLRWELCWFGRLVRDLIVPVQNSQHTLRMENQSRARLLGVESELQITLFTWLSFTGNYTFLRAINTSDNYLRGKRIPGAPEHEAFARLALSRAGQRVGLRGWVELDVAGNNFLSPYNDVAHEVAARTLWQLGGSLEWVKAHLTFTVEVQNALDTIVLTDRQGRRVPLQDYLGFPLPGRTLFGTAHGHW